MTKKKARLMAAKQIRQTSGVSLIEAIKVEKLLRHGKLHDAIVGRRPMPESLEWDEHQCNCGIPDCGFYIVSVRGPRGVWTQ
jgi:hypothetical protein